MSAIRQRSQSIAQRTSAEAGVWAAATASVPHRAALAELPAMALVGVRQAETTYTRGDIARLFRSSERTVARWEQRYSLPVERKNARVLRYTAEAVTILCACGAALDREEATRLGLHPDAIFAIASRIRAESTQKDLFLDTASHPAERAQEASSDENRRLTALWNHPEIGPVLRALVRVMTTNLHPFAAQKP